MNIHKSVIPLFTIEIIATTSVAQHTNYITSTKKDISKFDNKFTKK